MSAHNEGMFVQVGVIPEDKPSIQFLWNEDPVSEIAVYWYVRHIFRLKDSPASANYALRRTATDNKATFFQVDGSVLINFYMDDYF